MKFKYAIQDMANSKAPIQHGEIAIFPNEDDDAEFDFLTYLDYWNRNSKQFKYWGEDNV